MRRLLIKQTRFLWLFFLIFSPELQLVLATGEYPNENITYPTRTMYFKGIPVEKYLYIGFQDEKNTTNFITSNYDYSDLDKYLVRVPGHGEPANTTNPGAVKLKGSASAQATLLNNNVTSLAQTGFTIAFWTKWAYTVSDITTRFVSMVNQSGELLWETGITHDRRVYVRRQVHKTRTTDEAPFWNLKFWNPENGDIDKAVTESSGGLEWFFVMIVQEKEQLRLHIGMPNGAFDCMYINYGLSDQLNFNQAQSRIMKFFGNNDDVYWQDLSIWDKPLCREEAFEYFKDCSGITGATFRFDQSTEKKTVAYDDSVRMVRDALRTGGCMSKGKAAQKSKRFATEPEIQPNGNQLVLFPNPASSVINIKLPLELSGNLPYTVTLTDLQGRKVRTMIVQPVSRSTVVSCEIPEAGGLPNGIYIVKLSSADKTFTRRIAINCGCR